MIKLFEEYNQYYTEIPYLFYDNDRHKYFFTEKEITCLIRHGKELNKEAIKVSISI